MSRSALTISGALIFALLLCSMFPAGNSQAAGCSGQLFFTTPTVAAQAPAAVVFGDFNNDTKADMAVADFGFSNVTIALGNGSGGFGTPQTFLSGFGAMSIATGDFNSDGRLDLIVADWFNHQVATSRGLGDGTFAAPRRFDVGLGPSQVVTGDFNGDNKVDFATAGYFANAVSVFLGDGTGEFSQATGSPFAAGTGPRSLRLADFNSDSKLDVAVAGDFGLRILLGDGLGGLTPAGGIIAAGQAPFYVDAGDFNGDSKLDLAVANNSSSDVSIFFGNGAGQFQLVDTVRVGAAPRDILVTDLDGSGKPDVVSTNFDANSITVLLNDGTGKLQLFKTVSVGNKPRAVASTDLNGDAKRDLAIANYESYTVSVLMGIGGGDFNVPAIIPVFSNPAHSLAVGDFNGDTRADLAAGANGRTSILLANGSGGFNRVADVGFGPGAFVSSIDLDGDGKLDLVVSDGAGGNTVSSMPGLGDGNFGPRRTRTVGTSPMSIATGDFNSDGKPDAATSNFGSSNLSIILGDGLGGFGPATSVLVFAQTPFVASGDFNNDGKTDLVTAAYQFGGSALLLGNGNAQFALAAGSPFDSGPEPQAIAVGDFNGDGDADLAITNRPPSNPAQNAVAVLLGNGNGGFSAPVKYTVGLRPSSIAIGDYNLDGKPDLATADDDSNGLSVLIGNGDGTFGAATSYPAGLNPVFVATGDFNNDGRKDLAAATDLGVVVLPNICTSSPVAQTSLSVADTSILELNGAAASAVFTVTLSAPSDATVSVSYNTFGLTASASTDFQSASGRIKFAPGVTTQTVTVPITGDDIDEFDETIGIRLSEELNATISRSHATATIIDNDPPSSVSFGDVSTQEGDAGTKTANVTVSLSKASGKPITVQYATADNTAFAGSDYVATSGTLNFSPGEIQKVVAVQVNGDTFFEADETLLVNLTSASNASPADGQGVGTIVNDDTLKLILDESGPAVSQATALESLLLVRDPLHVLSIADWLNLGPDRNTRVTVFSNLLLNQGESISTVVVSLVASTNQTFDVAAEDVRALVNTPFTQVTFRLPNSLANGAVTVTIKMRGQTSNAGTIRIAP